MLAEVHRKTFVAPEVLDYGNFDEITGEIKKKKIGTADDFCNNASTIAVY